MGCSWSYSSWISALSCYAWYHCYHSYSSSSPNGRWKCEASRHIERLIYLRYEFLFWPHVMLYILTGRLSARCRRKKPKLFRHRYSSLGWTPCCSLSLGLDCLLWLEGLIPLLHLQSRLSFLDNGMMKILCRLVSSNTSHFLFILWII